MVFNFSPFQDTFFFFIMFGLSEISDLWGSDLRGSTVLPKKLSTNIFRKNTHVFYYFKDNIFFF